LCSIWIAKKTVKTWLLLEGRSDLQQWDHLAGAIMTGYHHILSILDRVFGCVMYRRLVNEAENRRADCK